LLDVFWEDHDPTDRAWSRQYRSFVFYHDDNQEKLALETKEREAKKRDAKIQTEILPITRFYLAEDYHQKYQLRQHRDLMNEFKGMYTRNIDFVNSTAAARINGYVGGYPNITQLETNIKRLGLSPAGQKRLLEIVKR